MQGLGITSCPLREHVHPRALRFSAGATAAVLIIALPTVDPLRPLALGLLATQIAVFGFTAFVSVHWSVWAQFFARYIWPRLTPANRLEEARPARFAQGIGFVLTALALLAFIVATDVIGIVLTVVAIVGSALRAATGTCLGCKLYLLDRRLRQVGA